MEMNPNLYLDEARGMTSIDLLDRQCDLRVAMNGREILGPESKGIVTVPNNPALLIATLGEVFQFSEPVERSVTAHADSIQRFVGKNPFYTRWGLEEPGHGKVIQAIQEESGVEVDQTEETKNKILYSILGATRHLPFIGDTARDSFRLYFAQAGFINEIVNMHGQANTTRIARNIDEPGIGKTYAELRAQEVTHAQYFATEIALSERSLPMRRMGVAAMSRVEKQSSNQAPIGANTPERKVQFGRLAIILTDDKPEAWIENDVRKLAEVVYLPEAALAGRRKEEYELRVETMLDQYREPVRLAREAA